MKACLILVAVIAVDGFGVDTETASTLASYGRDLGFADDFADDFSDETSAEGGTLAVPRAVPSKNITSSFALIHIHF
jgi:hypothetical protein